MVLNSRVVSHVITLVICQETAGKATAEATAEGTGRVGGWDLQRSAWLLLSAKVDDFRGPWGEDLFSCFYLVQFEALLPGFSVFWIS